MQPWPAWVSHRLWEESTDVNDGGSVMAAMLGAGVQARSGVKRSLGIHLLGVQ